MCDDPERRTTMASIPHKFKIGQAVDLIPSVSRLAANGRYQIVSLRPSEGEIPQYRIKSMRELHERVVAENELTLLRQLDTP
jgi:hypothetical protein